MAVDMMMFDEEWFMLRFENETRWCIAYKRNEQTYVITSGIREEIAAHLVKLHNKELKERTR